MRIIMHLGKTLLLKTMTIITLVCFHTDVAGGERVRTQAQQDAPVNL